MSKNPNFIPVEIKLTKKLYPIQSDFINWKAVSGKTQLFIPTNVILPKKPGNQHILVDSNDYEKLSRFEQNFTEKVYKFIMKNSKNEKNISNQYYGTNYYINPFIISEAQKLFTDKELLSKFIKEQGPFIQSSRPYAPKQIRIIDTANFIIRTYFIVPNSKIPITINNEKFFVKAVKEFVPKLSDSFELSDKLNCFIKLHCCNKDSQDFIHKSNSFICNQESTICGEHFPTNSSDEILEKSKEFLKTIDKKKEELQGVKNFKNESVTVQQLLKQLDDLEIEFKENKFYKFADSPRIYFPEDTTLTTDESLEKLMIGLINKKLSNKSNHNGCVYKFKGKSSKDIIKLATSQKWVEKQKELQELANTAGFTTSQAEIKEEFKKHQEWMNNKGVNYWCYIINYINFLKLKDGYLECEYTLALELDKSVTSKMSIKNLKDDCKSGKQKLEMQKSCDAICEESVKDKSLASDSKCLFCKIIMDCGFGKDNQLVIKDSFGRVKKNKPTNLNVSPLDIREKNSENYCGDNFDVSSSNMGIALPEHSCKEPPSGRAFERAILEKKLSETKLVT